MASNRCPACTNENTRDLKRLSPDEKVQYHRCDGCGHVWVTFKDGRSLHHVTALKVAGDDQHR